MRLNNIATPVIAWMAATLLLGALASALLTRWQADSNLRKAHSAFETHSFEVVERLQNRMRLYEYGLRGVRGTVLTAGENGIKATLNKPSKISAQTWMTQFFGLLCLSRGPFGQFAGR